ncbi:MAG: hypothetical protein JW749_03925 [Sedimentisphaerales bacterium]|nr:hypothetical protein [Sedimentisphaerales bacterium]
MEKVMRINLSMAENPELMDLINTPARVQNIKSAFAHKRFLHQTLPKFIERERENLTHFNSRRQAKNIKRARKRPESAPQVYSPHVFLPVMCSPCKSLVQKLETGEHGFFHR